MAFELTGTIREKIFTTIVIPLLRQSLVAQNFVVTDNQVKAESMKIWGVGKVKIDNYTGGRLTSRNHKDTSVTLNMDEKRSFSEDINRFDTFEAAVSLLAPVLQEGIYNIADEIDYDVFKMLGTTLNKIPGVALDETNIFEWIASFDAHLTRSKAPMMGRKLAISPEINTILIAAGFKGGSDSIATQAGRAGYIGRLSNMDIYVTNNCPLVTETFSTLNVTDIPVRGIEIVIDDTTAVSGTAVLATVDGFEQLQCFDQTDYDIAVKAQRDVAVLVNCIATSQRGAALGIGFQEFEVEKVQGSPIDNAWGVMGWGKKKVRDEFIVKSAPTFA